jgi:1-acyl-sn-glycerol-3-phosphate acyltransferase
MTGRVYGLDVDRVTAPEPPATALRRRLDGRYPVDAFGADPHLMDMLAAIVGGVVRVDVHYAERIPATGPALLVCSRGVAEGAAVTVGVLRATGRRVRAVGAPELFGVGPLVRKLGAVAGRPEDVIAVLRAGHVAALPLGASWFPVGAAEPRDDLLSAAAGFPVIPVAIVPGGPWRLPLRPWRVIVGQPQLVGTGIAPAVRRLREQRSAPGFSLARSS